MLQGPGAGDMNAQLMSSGGITSGLVQPPSAPAQVQLPSGSYHSGDQAHIYPAASREGILNTHPLLNPNMVMSMLPRSLPGPLPQMTHGIAQPEMAFSMPSFSGGMPQFLLPNLTVRPTGTNSENPMTSNGLPLMNVNISSSNFTKAINFDAASNRATTGCGSRKQAPGDQDRDTSGYFQSEDGDLLEQSTVSEPNVDLIEQQQATAQAQLLDRFKQLRQWQASQQEMLMKQQQEQLAMLREEQSRVQMMIVKQRENQWGASGVINHVTNSQLKSPAKKPPHPSQSTLPHAIAQSTLAMAKLNRQCGTVSDEAFPQPNTPPVVKGRPVPNIASGPSTPLEYLEHGNPNLDSDSNTVTSGTPLEDGIQRLADTASECSEAPGAGAAYFHSKNEMSQEEKQQRENSGKKYGPPIPFPLVDDERLKGQRLFENEMSQVSGSGSDQDPVALRPLQTGGQLTLAQHQNYSMNPSQVSNGGQLQSCRDQAENAENHILDFRDFYPEAQNDNSCDDDDDDDQSKYIDEDDQCKYDSEEYQNDVENKDEDAQFKEQSEFIQETESVQNDRECENDQNYENHEKPINPEDKPVVGAKKTFEELLEEELQKEEARKQGSGASAPQKQSSETKGSQKKAFLRRREGLARFGGHNKKPPQKKPTSKASNPAETRSSKSTENSTKPTNKKTSTASTIGKKEQVQGQISTNNVKTSPPSKTSGSNTGSAPSVSKTTTAAASQVCAPSKGMVPSKPSKLQLKVPPAAKTTSPQKPQNNVTHKTANSANVVIMESKPSDSTGEMSFQRCMKDHAKYEEIESEELQEFEILEQFADDNASFLSNVSVVNQVLSEEKKAKSSQYVQSSRSLQSATSQFTAAPGVTSGQHAESSGGEDSESEDEMNSTLRESPPEYDHHPTLQRKVSQLEHRSPLKGKMLNQGDDSDVWEEFERIDGQQLTGNMTDDSNVSESSSAEESDTDTEDNFDIKDIILHSKFNDGRITKSERTDNTCHSVAQPSHTESQNCDDAQLCNGVTSHKSKVAGSSQNAMDGFNDDEEWKDSEEVRAQGHAAQLPSNVSCPIVKTKVYPEQNGAGESDMSTTPPTSKLVTKLFPQLKPEKPKCSPVTIEQQEQLSNMKQVPLGDGIQSKALRDKLVELEREIERFRKENASLEALRKEREEGLQHLKKEMAEFEKQKAAELQHIQEYKNEEMKKLKKERRVFEQYQKASKGKFDKKDREEIESLKKQLKELQDELKHKEQRWAASTSRLRDRLEYVERENAELKEEIKLLEKKRLEAWQQKETGLPSKTDKKQDIHSASGVHPCTSVQQPSETTAGQVTASAFSESQSSRPLGHSHVNRNAPVIVACDKSRSDTVTELPDSASQALADLNVTNDESLIMQTVPQAMSRGPASKHHTSSPSHAVITVPTAVTSSENRVNVPRKTAVAVNISQTVDKGDEEYEELQHSDGKIERIYTNGAREILFSNGTRKQVSADGQSIIVSFFNGDIKQIMPDQRVVYYYADAQTTHTTYPDGLEIIQFPNNQIEKNYPDGTREITFPDQTIKYLFPTGVEESIFPDGTVIRVERNGDKVMEFPNGQREIHTPQYKRREYPDGTVKTVYPDGRQETRYSSGRIRVKDRDGQVIIDRRL